MADTESDRVYAKIFAQGSRQHGWVRLQFGFSKPTSDFVKSLPGAKWGPMQGVPAPWTNSSESVRKAWFVPAHSWEVLAQEVPNDTRWLADRVAPIPEGVSGRLRPYQLSTAEIMARYRAYFLLFDMRVGKTPTALAAAMALMEGGYADVTLILYPAQVGLGWQRETKAWAQSELVRLEGHATADDTTVDQLRSTSFLFLGCHYEILSQQEETIARALDGRRVVVIADECQLLQNRKVARGKTAIRISRGKPWTIRGDVAEESKYANVEIVSWYALSGTPMRNKPKNLWLPFELALPGSMGGDMALNPRGEIGGYWKYGQRYCDAREGQYGWIDSGVSNAKELHARLGAISTRITRAEVASHLPPSERRIIYCEATGKALEHYAKIEAQHAGALRNVLAREGEALGGAQKVLEALARETAIVKIPKALERIEYHLDRGVKIVAFGHFQETVKALSEAVKAKFGEGFQLYDAGTWQSLSPDDRRLVVEAWSKHEGPALLLANSLASGVGIDMSQGEGAIHLELEWVPTDLRQREARVDDVHLGTRSVPSWHEYLLLRDTIDEAMAGILLSKISAIEAVVGGDRETSGLGTLLRDSGLVKEDTLGLDTTNKEAVNAALDHLRAKLLGGKIGRIAADPIAEVAELEEDSEDDDR